MLIKKYAVPLPSTFIPSKQDCSKNEQEVNQLSDQYGIDYSSAAGSLIYLIKTYIHQQFAVMKLAKFSRLPGKVHFEAMIHLLHHLRVCPCKGLKFCSKLEESPSYSLLLENELPLDKPLLTFSDSSLQDCPDTRRSTGSFVIFYHGGVVDASSSVPTPVALSSAEAEYNACCNACMATAHVRMLLMELDGKDPDTKYATPMILDS